MLLGRHEITFLGFSEDYDTLTSQIKSKSHTLDALCQNAEVLISLKG